MTKMTFRVTVTQAAISAAIHFPKEEPTFFHEIKGESPDDRELELTFGDHCQASYVPYFMN